MNFDFLSFFTGDDGVCPDTGDVSAPVINPSTGLPMLDNEIGGVDLGGSPFGMDIYSDTSDAFTDIMGSNSWE